MRRQHVGWALVFVVFTLVPAAWWLLNVYAPPPRALAFPEDASEPSLKSLNYEWVGSSAMEPYDTGMLRLRNTDKVTWTQIDVEIGVFAQPSNARFEFKCPTPSTVPPGQVLIVRFQACANRLPNGIGAVALTTLRIQAHEGSVIGAGFEPGISFVPYGLK
jgi:hypothetical protein